MRTLDVLGFSQAETFPPRRNFSLRKLNMGLVVMTLTIATWIVTRNSRAPLLVNSASNESENLLDARLERAANIALAQHHGGDGTVIVLDPQTGRIRALVNSHLAFERAFPPGSTIKPFVTLSALRGGLIDGRSRMTCRGAYSRDDLHSSCSHPKHVPPMNASEALAYSCNDFFGTVGGRLNVTKFEATLAEFGFGEPIGLADQESVGQLVSSRWQKSSVLGEGDYMLVTPVQLITAYSALINGGHLLTPEQAPNDRFIPQTRRNLSISSTERAAIISGMRGTVRYGTASSSGLDSVPAYIFGKTGTATQIGGFRNDGWFVGFAATPAEDSTNQPHPGPEDINLAVLVFLRKAHGSEAAEIAKPIFEAFTNTHHPAPTSTRPASTLATLPQEDGAVRVHLVTENVTRAISLEDYVAAVVATEGSTEEKFEALKALAITIRSYAVKNLKRHSAEGYDFCSTTHCQRYGPISNDRVLPAHFREAVRQTEGQVLLSAGGQIAEVYFGASCGGSTANLMSLWGVSAPAHLRGVKDEFCASTPHSSWTDVISSSKLLEALRSDPRTNVGGRLDNLVVIRRDASERAQLIHVEGEHRRVVTGWDFKIIVGRALGWNLIKSSRFEVGRSGSNFVFRGSGFGHGLGLCQEGAHVMAQRGATYRQILEHYFPGTSIGKSSADSSFADVIWANDVQSLAKVPRSTAREKIGRRQLSTEHLRLTYPTSISDREAEQLLAVLESSRKDLARRVAAAGLPVQMNAINVYLNNTTGDFVGRTGQPPWVAAATKGSSIDLQPLPLLKRRRILETTVRHELVHAVVNSLYRGTRERWLEEGFALHLAGEGPLLAKYSKAGNKTAVEIESMIDRARNVAELRTAYAAAYHEVSRLIRNSGEASVWRRF